jgi:ferredoxin-type protein NapH
MSGGGPAQTGRLDARSLRWQLFRKLTQLSMLTLVVWAAANMLWRNFKVAHNNARLVELLSDPFTAKLYDWNDRLLEWLGGWIGLGPLELSERFLGEPWALTLGPFHLVDPMAVGSVLVQGQSLSTGTLLMSLLPLLLAAVLGKVFCSFLCPARLAFEVGSALRLGLIWLGLPLPTIRLPRIGGFVLVGALLFAAGSGSAVLHFTLPYLAFASAVVAAVATGTVSAAAFAFGTMFAVDVLVAPGQICHSLCPTGALLETAGRFSLLRLRKRPEPCPPSCSLCQRACPYGLFPGAETHAPACDTCGRCTAFCPTRKLRPALGRPMATAPREESAA